MKISIITATYNSSKTIKATIESILNQDFQNFEHIIVDGLSSDGTVEIIRSYEQYYGGRLKMIIEKDNGLYDAMNKGVAMASGDIVGILNSDDIFSCKNALSLISDEFKHSDCEAVYSDLIFMDNETLTIPVRKWIAKTGNYKFGWHPPHPTLYIKKDLYEKFGNFDSSLKIAADYDFMLRLMKKGVKMGYIPKTLIYMRAGGVSTNGISGYVSNLRESHKVLKKNKIHNAALVDIIRILKTIFQVIKK